MKKDQSSTACAPITEEELSRLSLFRGLSSAERKEFSAHTQAKKRRFSAGEPIEAYEKTEKALIAILSGEAVVKRRGENEVLLNRLFAGDIFGVSTLFGGGTPPTEVTAVKEAVCLFLSEEDVRSAITAYPSVAIEYITFLSEKIRFLNQKMAGFSAKDAEAKLACYLLSHEKNNVVILKNFSKAAKELSVGRASFYRAIAALEDEGAIRREGDTITIIQKNILERIKEK